MPTPGEHKTVQSRILGYAEAIGWTIVSREEAEQRRGFDPDVPPAERARNRSLFFDDLLDALATVQPNDQVTQKLTWSRKGGTSTARKLFTGPGVVTGSASVSFKVS